MLAMATPLPYSILVRVLRSCRRPEAAMFSVASKETHDKISEDLSYYARIIVDNNVPLPVCMRGQLPSLHDSTEWP